MGSPKHDKNEEFGYLNIGPAPDINLPRDEGFREKFWRKSRQNPFVPIGLGVTICALTFGIYQLKTGNTKMSQKMMRVRVGAQGFTIAALMGGVLYEAYKAKKTPKG